MARPKGIGYTPDFFDQQFLKILIDLQSRGLALAKNERRLEVLLGLTKGVLWKLKAGQTGISKFKRDNVVKQLQLIFAVNPLYFGQTGHGMYNEGGPKTDYIDIPSSTPTGKPSFLTAGDAMELQHLKIQVESFKDQLKSRDLQIKTLQSQVNTLQKLVNLYEKNSAKFSAKEKS